MGRVLFLTGLPGAGKTTALRRVVDALGDGCCHGFLTEEMRNPISAAREGFQIVWRTPLAPLAHVDVMCLGEAARMRQNVVGKYVVDVAAVDTHCTDAIHCALTDPLISVLVIDEVGKMELFSQRFREAVLAAVVGPKPVVGTIMLKGGNAFIDSLKQMPNVEVWEVTADNRDRMCENVVAWVRALLPERPTPPSAPKTVKNRLQ